MEDKLKSYILTYKFVRGNLFICPKNVYNYDVIEESILQTATITNLKWQLQHTTPDILINWIRWMLQM